MTTTLAGLRQELADCRSYSRELMAGYKATHRFFIEVSKLIAEHPALLDKLSPETREQVAWASLCDLPESDKS